MTTMIDDLGRWLETTPGLLLSGATLVASGALVAWFLQARRQRAAREAQRARDDEERSLLILQQEMDALREQLAQSIHATSEGVNRQLARMSRALDQRLHHGVELTQQTHRALGERLDATAQVVGAVQRSLGTLEEANRRLFEVGRDIASLQEILRPPKLRGGLGELLLEDLLRQVLPAEHLEFQHTFTSGHRVDAVVRLGGGLVPIDAKFPLENFRRWLDAEDDAERSRCRRAFAADVRRHVDAIADRYILPAEGTLDFALMYIPAENVFYEIVVKDESKEGADILDHALQRRVIPVSAGSFYAYLQVIALGLRGLRIEQRAREIMEQMGGLRGEIDRLRDAYRLVGRHIGNAAASAAAAERRLEQVDARLSALAGDGAEASADDGDAAAGGDPS